MEQHHHHPHGKIAHLSGMAHAETIKGSEFEHDGHKTAVHESAEALRKVRKYAGE